MAAIVGMPFSVFGMDFSLPNKNAFSDKRLDGPNLPMLLHGDIQPGDYERLLKYAAINRVGSSVRPEASLV